MCMAEPECKLFIANSLCCLDYGILQHASVQLWLVCNADIYLPDPKCLTVTDTATGVDIPTAAQQPDDPLFTVNVTVLNIPNARAEELQVDLPLAFYVPPIARVPGELPLRLDFEQKRMVELDGLCSLRLRAPCEWEGALYQAVGPVQAVPLTSVLSANETAFAEELVQAVLVPPPSPEPTPEPTPVVTDGPTQVVSERTVVFSFAPDSPTSPGLFECRLADGDGNLSDPAVHVDWTPCTSPSTYTNLPDGSYQFTVREVGGTGVATSTFVVAADAATPSPPTIELPSPPPEPSPSPPSEPSPSPPPPTVTPPTGSNVVIGRRLRSLVDMLRHAVHPGLPHKRGSLGDGAQDRRQGSAPAGSGAGSRRLMQDLLASDGGVVDTMLFDYMNGGVLSGGEAGVDPLTFDAPAMFSQPASNFRSLTVIGDELPVPAVDASLLPPLTNVLAPIFNETDLYEDYFISWVPRNETEGLCMMTNSADLPETFLLGDFEELVGYEEDCGPESLPEVGSNDFQLSPVPNSTGDGLSPLPAVPIG